MPTLDNLHHQIVHSSAGTRRDYETEYVNVPHEIRKFLKNIEACLEIGPYFSTVRLTCCMTYAKSLFAVTSLLIVMVTTF